MMDLKHLVNARKDRRESLEKMIIIVACLLAFLSMFFIPSVTADRPFPSDYKEFLEGKKTNAALNGARTGEET